MVEATPEQIAAEKVALRAKLRAEYWKQVTNPHLHGTGEGGHIVSGAKSIFSLCYVIIVVVSH